MVVTKHKRVLLMYISQVSGHRQGAVAIAKSLKSLDPDCEILSINGFGYAYPVMEKIVNTAYMGVIKRVPKIWEYLYDNPKIVKFSEKWKQSIHKSSHKKLKPLIDEFKPDVVVCTQAFPCGMVADYKKAHGLDFTVIGVLTDHAPHLYWLHEGVDYYVVPSQEARDRYVKQGVSPERIKILGIPIRMKFAESAGADLIAQKLGLDLSIPTVLIMGGGQGLGPMKEAVKSLVRLKRPLQLIVICGTNVKLVHWIKKIRRKTSKKIIFYEYASNVDELMEVASLIVTKPGGMTTSECLAKGLPMVIVDPIPGQEERNSQFLVNQGIAVRVDDKRRIGPAIDGLLDDPKQLAAMKHAALGQAKPLAAKNIALLILDGAV
ncbi:MAG: glycosyltransferase [Candidatus Omnitrophica bacterium]|nr:glycosyltransferase [Candidatus Omnitrophota bacterium]MDE2222667.1 glycosyltransferase [Candidatus Omnitrophota bacterium]